MAIILAIDFGKARLGLAICDGLEMMAHPLRTIHRQSNLKDTEIIKQICVEREVEILVVGMPYSLSGEKQIAAEAVDKFIGFLRENINLPIETVDERLTSAESNKRLIEMDISRKNRKNVVDQMAAALILENYLARRRCAKES
ncbi:MAG: Holliday junction resolvase RuvX [Armatimonadota bacterium]